MLIVVIMVSSVAGGFSLIGTLTTCDSDEQIFKIGAKSSRLLSALKMKCVVSPYLDLIKLMDSAK